MSAHEADRGPVQIGELSRVGVTPEVLRAWERRYGILSPARTDGGFRLYDEDDERRVRRTPQPGPIGSRGGAPRTSGPSSRTRPRRRNRRPKQDTDGSCA